jgi:hypothetical protein
MNTGLIKINEEMAMRQNEMSKNRVEELETLKQHCALVLDYNQKIQV